MKKEVPPRQHSKNEKEWKVKHVSNQETCIITMWHYLKKLKTLLSRSLKKKYSPLTTNFNYTIIYIRILYK